jgi:hypothetical protein
MNEPTTLLTVEQVVTLAPIAQANGVQLWPLSVEI